MRRNWQQGEEKKKPKQITTQYEKNNDNHKNEIYNKMQHKLVLWTETLLLLHLYIYDHVSTFLLKRANNKN